MKQITVALLLATAFTGLSCTDRPEAAPRADLFGPSTPLGGLVACRMSTPASASETIGPDGGTIEVGPHVLRILPGALTSDVTITATVPADTVVRVDLQPEGLQFERPVYLTLSYADCGLVRSFLPKRIAFTTVDLDIISYLLSFDNLFAQRVTGRLEHFSTYAVAW